MRDRRSDFDVSNTVQVSDPDAVCAAVRSIWTSLYPDTDFAPIASAFDQFTRAFRGDSDRYHPIETTYHDLQHTLDVTLAMARLVDGYERSPQTRSRRLGATRAAVGLITALFHDAGYLRRINDTRHEHGAEYTRIHVSRSADIIADLLPELGFADAAPVACEMVHYTGYERSFDSLEIDDPLWRKTGHLLGTADMLAQMADRCYLEKCRDRLYDEFVKGGMARMRAPDGRIIVNYESPHHLLRKTPDFCRATLEQRIGQQFEHAERFFEVHFNGRNLYMDAIDRNLAHLEWVLEEDRWDQLRRKPLCYNVDYFRNDPLKGDINGRNDLLLH